MPPPGRNELRDGLAGSGVERRATAVEACWPCAGARRRRRPPSSAAWSGPRPGPSCSNRASIRGQRRPSLPTWPAAETMTRPGWSTGWSRERLPCRLAGPRPWRPPGERLSPNASGDLDGAAEGFARAVSLHHPAMPLARSDTLTDYGSFLLRHGQAAQARPVLAEALALAEGCGAGWHARQARVAWRRAGGRGGHDPVRCAHTPREGGRRPGPGRADQPGDRRPAVPFGQHGPDPPGPRVPQAGYQRSLAADRRPRAGSRLNRPGAGPGSAERSATTRPVFDV